MGELSSRVQEHSQDVTFLQNKLAEMRSKYKAPALYDKDYIAIYEKEVLSIDDELTAEKKEKMKKRKGKRQNKERENKEKEGKEGSEQDGSGDVGENNYAHEMDDSDADNDNYSTHNSSTFPSTARAISARGLTKRTAGLGCKEKRRGSMSSISTGNYTTNIDNDFSDARSTKKKKPERVSSYLRGLSATSRKNITAAKNMSKSKNMKASGKDSKSKATMLKVKSQRGRSVLAGKDVTTGDDGDGCSTLIDSYEKEGRATKKHKKAQRVTRQKQSASLSSNTSSNHNDMGPPLPPSTSNSNAQSASYHSFSRLSRSSRIQAISAPRSLYSSTMKKLESSSSSSSSTSSSSSSISSLLSSSLSSASSTGNKRKDRRKDKAERTGNNSTIDKTTDKKGNGSMDEIQQDQRIHENHSASNSKSKAKPVHFSAHRPRNPYNSVPLPPSSEVKSSSPLSSVSSQVGAPSDQEEEGQILMTNTKAANSNMHQRYTTSVAAMRKNSTSGGSNSNNAVFGFAFGLKHNHKAKAHKKPRQTKTSQATHTGAHSQTETKTKTKHDLEASSIMAASASSLVSPPTSYIASKTEELNAVFSGGITRNRRSVKKGYTQKQASTLQTSSPHKSSPPPSSTSSAYKNNVLRDKKLNLYPLEDTTHISPTKSNFDATKDAYPQVHAYDRKVDYSARSNVISYGERKSKHKKAKSKLTSNVNDDNSSNSIGSDFMTEFSYDDLGKNTSGSKICFRADGDDDDGLTNRMKQLLGNRNPLL